MELPRWSRSLAWLSIFFVASGMALVACGGGADSVDVTGTSTGLQIEGGTMSGPTLPTTGWEATTLRDAVYVYTNEMSDRNNDLLDGRTCTPARDRWHVHRHRRLRRAPQQEPRRGAGLPLWHHRPYRTGGVSMGMDQSV